MRARDVADYIEELAPIESGISGDDNGFNFGDPDRNVQVVGVTWMPTTAALSEAAALGVTLLVVHEAWRIGNQRSGWYSELGEWSKAPNLARARLLLDANMCIYRCHSNWDARPGDGVVDRIAPELGLEREIARGRFTRVYEIEPTSLAELAVDVKARLHLPGVRLFGDRAQTVSRVSPLIGGFGGNQHSMPEEVRRLGADAIIVGDLVEYVTVHALELGLGVIETLHSATENPAMRRLAYLLQARFPSLDVRYLESGTRARLSIV